MKYIINKNHQFYCQITPNGYAHKPSPKEVCIIQNTLQPTEISINDFVSKISMGYAYRAGEKSKDMFTNFQIISFDIDGCPTQLMTYIDNLKDKPTIAYTSPSNGNLEHKKEREDGIYRYRLIYISNNLLSGWMLYDTLRNLIMDRNNMTYTDKRSYPANHYFNGNANPTIEIYVSGCIYNFEDELSKKVDDIEVRQKEIRLNKKHRCGGRRTVKLENQLISLGVNPKLAHDCVNESFQTFPRKWLEYFHPTIKKMKFSSDYINGVHPYAEIASDNYKTVLRYRIWNPNKKSFVERKWHDGENRHGKIFYSAKVIKELNTWLTLEQFIWWTVNEYVLSYDNRDTDGLPKYTLKSFIENITLPVWFDDSSTNFTPKHAKIHVKDDAVAATGKTKKQLVPAILSDLRRNGVMKEYDPSISIDKNLQKFKEKKIKISRRTLIRYLNKQKNTQNRSPSI